MTYLGTVQNRHIPLKAKVHVHSFARKLPLCFELFSSGDFRPAVFTDAMAYKGIFKYDFDPPVLDDAVFSRSFKEYSRLIRDTYLYPCASPARIAAERPDGSSGIYHKVRKRDLLSAPSSELAIRSFASIADLLMAIFVSFLKDEMRSSVKDTRQVNGGPLPHWILEAIMMLYSEEAIEHHVLFAVGSSPFYGGWHELICRVLNFRNHAASDVKMMDSHMHPRFMQADAEFFRSCHSSVCTDCIDAHDYVFDATLNTPMVMHNGAIWQKHAGHNSGGRCTCGRNSRYMLWLFCYGHALLNWGGSLTDHVTPLIYGDDSICGSNRSVADLTSLFEAMSTVGHQIKYEFGAIAELPFLSFKSHLHSDGRYYPVPHDRVRFASHVVCGLSDSPEVVEAKLNSLRLLAYFDLPIYQEITNYLVSSGLICYDRSFLSSIMFPTKEARREDHRLPRDVGPGRALEQLAQNIMSAKKVIITKPQPKPRQPRKKPAVINVAVAPQSHQPSRSSSSSHSSSSRDPDPRYAPGGGSFARGTTGLIPCENGQSLVSQRMDPRTHYKLKKGFLVPPSYGCEAAHIVSHPVFTAKFADHEGKPTSLYLLFQRNKRAFMSTAGVVRTVPIGPSNTPNVLTFTHIPNVSAADPLSMWTPLHAGSVAVCASKFSAAEFIGWPLNFTVAQAANQVKIKLAAEASLGHSLSYRYQVYDAAGTYLSGGAADLNNDAAQTITVSQVFAANTQYWLRAWVVNNQPLATEIPLIQGEIYSDTASSIVFPNIATVLDVIDIPNIAHTDPNSLVDAATIWVQNLSSAMFNGGFCAVARVPAEWSPKLGQSIAQSLTALAVDEFDGGLKTGSYAWNNQPTPFYIPKPNNHMAHNSNFIVGLLQVSDATNININYKPCWSVFHSGGDASFGYRAPAACPSWDEVNRICATAVAVCSNDNHQSYVQRFVSGLPNFLKRPDVRDAAVKVAKILGPMALGLVF